MGKLLNIDSSDTGFNFDLYNKNAVIQYEFQNVVRKFSSVSAAIGFLPLPIADIIILTPIQIGLIAKISNMYNFDLDPKEFLKMVGGTIGAGFIFKITSKIVCSMIPVIGWGVNAAIAFAGTYSIAILTKRYIEVNGQLTKDSIKEIWEKSFKEGKDEFSNLKGYIFKKKDELLSEIEKYKNKVNTSSGKTKTKTKKTKEENSKENKEDLF
jgi:uncharacterized protein (DUF697 family)